jgi:cytochrome P450
MLDTTQYHGAKRPPSPPIPGVVQMVAWGLRPIDLVSACARRYGDTFTIRFIQGRSITYVNRPESVGDLSALDPGQFLVGAEARDLLEPFLGANSLLVLDGEEHARARRTVARAFHAESFAAQEQAMLEMTQRALASWPFDTPVALHDRMQALTLEVILRVLFGVSDDSLDDLLSPLREFLALAGSVVILLEPLRTLPGVRRTWARFTELRAQIDDALTALVRTRRAAGEVAGPVDVLSALSRARDDAGLLLDEAVVRDHLLTLLLAGHDTTATALAWGFDLLAHHPGVAVRLASDLGNGDDAYLDAVIKEILRVRPIIPDVVRRILEPTSIGGVSLPAGTTVGISTHLLHRRPDLYADPDEFRPDRFLDRPVDPHAWIPFGLGVRRCLGIAFATLEMRSVLRTVVSTCTIRPVRRSLEGPKRRAVTLIPRHGAPVVLSGR